MNFAALPVAIIGAGPVGLAAAAHVLARGGVPLVLEAGPRAGHAVRQWGHVRMFTPWRYCVDHQAAALLATRGWTHPAADDIPTGHELASRYLEPLAASLAPHVHFDTRVLGVSREGCDKVRTAGRDSLPFVVRGATPDGGERTIKASAVIDASGIWSTPNPAGADGLPAIGEREAADRIATGIPDVLGADRALYAGRTTAVVGGGHSALNVLIDLAALRQTAPGTRILWLMRKDRVEAAFGGEAADALAARGALGSQGRVLVESGAVEVVTPFRIAAISREAGRLRIEGDHNGETGVIAADRMVVATGFRPDLSILREIRLALDPWLESVAGIGALIDPNLHSCGTVRPHGAIELAHPETGFFIAGMKSYGRAPTFLMATGHEQVRSIAAFLAGDVDAARRVELELPETGVCNVAPRAGLGAAACCDSAPARTAACCDGAPAPVAACCGAVPEPVSAFEQAATACRAGTGAGDVANVAYVAKSECCGGPVANVTKAECCGGPMPNVATAECSGGPVLNVANAECRGGPVANVAAAECRGGSVEVFTESECRGGPVSNAVAATRADPRPPVEIAACCLDDAKAKADGLAGCGCATAPLAATVDR